jgi:proteasome lid subunit RPN8/RPN11
MTEDFEIELIEDEPEEESGFQLPVNIFVVGEIANDDVDVYIKQDVFKALEDYSASDTEHELGSVLIGKFSDVLGKTSVVISNYIEAKYTDSSASTLTFTHESWEYIHREHEEKYSDEKILGWQHTHPGYGIFLSNYDMFIQENFFNLPFQVAYVIDPKQGTRGFFQWKNGEVQKLKGFYIYDEIGKPIKVDLSKKETESTEPEKKKQLPPYITIALIAAVVFLAGMVVNLNMQIREQHSDYNQLKSIVVDQDAEISALRNSTSQTTKAVTTDAETNKTEVVFKKYVVKSGDTLYSICKNNSLDFNANIGIIKSINGIENENSINVGQIILLPFYETE